MATAIGEFRIWLGAALLACMALGLAPAPAQAQAQAQREEGEYTVAQAEPRRPGFQRPGRGSDVPVRREPAPPAEDESSTSPRTSPPPREALPDRTPSTRENPPRRQERYQRGQRRGRDGRSRQPRARTKRTVDIPEYEALAIPDRWRLVENLGVNERWYDPYNQNTLKADRPIFGTQDWFVNLLLVSDTVFEARGIPNPTGVGVTNGRNNLDIFGEDDSFTIQQNFITSLSVVKANTAFKPPDWEFRIATLFNVNYSESEEFNVLFADPSRGNTREDWHWAITELFIDKHLWDRSVRYDFDSLRVGVQPFISDFRGFIYQDNNLGARLFGTFANNRLQYNLAFFGRIEKDTNSGIAEPINLRRDLVAFANLYYQDFPVLGFTQQFTAIYNRNFEGDEVHLDNNDFRQRPAPVGNARGHDYDVVYLGLNGEGHVDRLNLAYSLYYAVGRDERNQIADRETTISSFFLALEASYDRDWFRLISFLIFAQGDDDPNDKFANGFDTIFDNPQIAGAETGFWQRQAIPLIFGGGVQLSGRNSFVPSLRSSKEEGQSNFVNPGILIVGAGADWDILPQLRLVTNMSYLRFHTTEVLQKLRQQSDIDEDIGMDFSAGLIYRPLFINNVILRVSGAALVPFDGLKDLYDVDNASKGTLYSVLANLTLTF